MTHIYGIIDLNQSLPEVISMGHEATNLTTKSLTLEEFDNIILDIFENLGKHAIKGASDSTDAVFRLSANYLDRPAFVALKKFYDLYFGDCQIEEEKDSINQEVDEIVSQIKSKIDEGGSLEDVKEDEFLKRKRLGLAAVQKQLEGLITLNSGIKNQILPALSSMQFEDAVSQRVDHIIKSWKTIQKELFCSTVSKDEIEGIALKLANICSSVDETRDFYTIVLKEEPPEGETNRSVFLEF